MRAAPFARWLPRALLVSGASLLLLLQLANAQSASLIVPGVSIGAMKLGMSPTQARVVWGTPSRVRHVSPTVEGWEYSRRRSTLYFTAGKVYEIVTYSSAFATQEGVRVGQPIGKVAEVLGRPDCEKQVEGRPAPGTFFAEGPVHAHIYRKLGLVVVRVNDVVRGILVSVGPRC